MEDRKAEFSESQNVSISAFPLTLGVLSAKIRLISAFQKQVAQERKTPKENLAFLTSA